MLNVKGHAYRNLSCRGRASRRPAGSVVNRISLVSCSQDANPRFIFCFVNTAKLATKAASMPMPVTYA